jgi:hypothetical protein
MTRTNRKTVPAMIAALALVMASCSGDLSRSSSPVTLVLTNTQSLSRIDIATGATGCNTNIATVNVRALLLTSQGNPNLPTDGRFNTVQLTSYRVSYVRRDGGTLVPAPFTRATSGTITVGGAESALNNFLAFEVGALNQAPFAALRAAGGGRDPETGRSSVSMDLILEVFGETLAGERVSGSTRLTLDFCNACGGCA